MHPSEHKPLSHLLSSSSPRINGICPHTHITYTVGEITCSRLAAMDVLIPPIKSRWRHALLLLLKPSRQLQQCASKPDHFITSIPSSLPLMSKPPSIQHKRNHTYSHAMHRTMYEEALAPILHPSVSLPLHHPSSVPSPSRIPPDNVLHTIILLFLSLC